MIGVPCCLWVGCRYWYLFSITLPFGATRPIDVALAEKQEVVP